MFMTKEQQVLPVSEVAERLGVTPETIRRYLEDGRLDGYRVTPGLPRSPWRVYEASVIAFEQLRKGDTGPLS